MKLLVSACLLGQNCKYNGGNNYSEKVFEYVKGHEVIPVCPEVAGGLTTPRIPCEIVNGVVTNKNGESKDSEFRSGAELCLKKAIEENIDLAILQSRSPSCGVKQIYDGSFSGKLVEGKGIMAESHGAFPFSRDDKNKLKIKAFELKFTNYSDKMKHIFLGKNLQESSKGELGDGIWRDEHGKTHEVRKKALVDHIGGMLVDG